MTMLTSLPDTLRPLGREEATHAFAAILDGKADDYAIESFLIGLAERGETAVEIASAATAMRARMIPIEAPSDAIDVCGTGGDGQHSLNVSTAVAILLAAAGVPVAKHGNRAASSKSGAADTLEALGLDLERASAKAEETLQEIGIAFLFAANHHPALKRLAPLRKRIGRRTIFNLIGPLANPAHVSAQMIGVAHPDLVDTYAEAAQLVGIKRIAVVSGEEGLDELSPAGPSRIACSQGIELTRTIVPEDAGLSRHPLSALRGGDPAYNAAALRGLLAGEPGAYRDAVILNASAALIVAGGAPNLTWAAEEISELLDNGLAKALLDCWIAWP